MISDVSNLDELLAKQRKEKRELEAITQKMKHSVSKGDKKKKKEVNAEIAQLLANLNLKHENEIKEVADAQNLDNSNNSVFDGKDIECSNKDYEVSTAENQVENSRIPRISKAQKRRNKKAMNEKDRIKAIEEQELENMKGQRHLESEKIKKKLSERQLTIHEVPSDGNCLYKAVEHQLGILNIQKTTVQSLRELTSKYMLNHKEDYMPFLLSPETGDILTEEQYVKYCEDIANTTAWGGHVEIQALANILEVPIEVIQADGPSVIAGNENSNPKIILSYHRHVYGLGEHYNSVVPAKK